MAARQVGLAQRFASAAGRGFKACRRCDEQAWSGAGDAKDDRGEVARSEALAPDSPFRGMRRAPAWSRTQWWATGSSRCVTVRRLSLSSYASQRTEQTRPNPITPSNGKASSWGTAPAVRTGTTNGSVSHPHHWTKSPSERWKTVHPSRPAGAIGWSTRSRAAASFCGWVVRFAHG